MEINHSDVKKKTSTKENRDDKEITRNVTSNELYEIRLFQQVSGSSG
jgi:hypothetical protein